ncbi:ice-binding family protein [Arthrobacter sp. MI7-26]|uniref:ice-binding family protein n=1 Tax=Arthrobacter sp. MI7-26 TaxID=2993653 RepID=UPI002248AAA1|nr:ice-binding family protein [Arthrobacter sp. MI7-26]MCX2750081.1 ice-binding family protein [Arthrobacter sp. MI7-26]
MLSIAPGHTHLQTKFREGSRARRRTAAGAALGAAALVAWAVAGQSPAYAADAPVGLGTAAAYSVLGGTTVTNTGPTTLAGNLGVNPGSAITGFPPGLAAGATHAGDAQAGQAESALTTAYDDAAGRPMTASVAGDLVGQTLTAGVYKSAGPLAVSGALTLNGQGNPNSVFIFQVASTLTTASASSIVLTNSAQACNIYWQVGSSAILGTASTFKGNILALTSITATTGTSVEGRALARNGQVALDTNVFTMPGCATASPTSTTTPPPTGAPTAIASTSAGAGAGADAGTGTATTGTGLASTGSGLASTGRGLNIDTAAETHAPNAGPVIGAAALTAGLIGACMLFLRRRPGRQNK